MPIKTEIYLRGDVYVVETRCGSKIIAKMLAKDISQAQELLALVKWTHDCEVHDA